MENGEEDEKGVDDERDNVREGGEGEGHLSRRVTSCREPDGFGVRRYVVGCSAFFSLLPLL